MSWAMDDHSVGNFPSPRDRWLFNTAIDTFAHTALVLCLGN